MKRNSLLNMQYHTTERSFNMTIVIVMDAFIASVKECEMWGGVDDTLFTHALIKQDAYADLLIRAGFTRERVDEIAATARRKYRNSIR